MDSPEFPPNSEVSKRAKSESKNIERVTSGEATRRKKSLRRQFSEVFVAGDFKSAMRYATMEVLLPTARDMVLETVQQGLEKLFLGDHRRHRTRYPGMVDRYQTGPQIDYNRISRPSRLSSSERAMSRRARAQHNFDEIILDQRNEAEEVIDRLFELVSKYGAATVADLYDLVGLSSTHTDHKWGWTDLHGAGVSRIRGGFLLDLPEPHSLD